MKVVKLQLTLYFRFDFCNSCLQVCNYYNCNYTWKSLVREVIKSVTYQLWSCFSLGNEQWWTWIAQFPYPFFFIFWLNTNQSCGLPSSKSSLFLFFYLPCLCLSHSSVGGSTHRPWSFISWIRASVAFSIAIPRFRTVWWKYSQQDI